MAPYCVLAVGPEDRACGIEDFTEALNTARLTIMPGLRVISASKAVEAVQAFNKCISSFGRVEAAFLHHNFTAKGKEQFSDALKQVLKDHPDIPIICWGKVVKGGIQGKDFIHGLEWDAKAGSQPVLKCLQMLKNGQIGQGRKSHEATNSPRGSIDLQPQMVGSGNVRRSVELQSQMGSQVNVRRSIDMNSAGGSMPDRRVSFSSPRQSMEMANVRRSMEYNPYPGSPLQMNSQGSASQLMYAQPMTSPLAPAYLEPQPAAGGNTQVIKALADEVQRLKLLVEEKRAREKAAAADGASSSPQVSVGVVAGMSFV